MISRNAFSKTAALCAAVATALAVTAPSHAQATADAAPNAVREVATKQVRFQDLDLSSPRDRARLDSRLRGAVRSVCAGTARTGTRINSDWARCYSNALAGARSAVAPRIAAATARSPAIGD